MGSTLALVLAAISYFSFSRKGQLCYFSLHSLLFFVLGPLVYR